MSYNNQIIQSSVHYKTIFFRNFYLMQDSNQVNYYKWIRISFINFFIVSAVGVILRYKIIFPLPFVNQKFLLNGHSHFAFAGWVSQILMVLIVQYIQEEKKELNARRYNFILWANFITAYGMLLSFPFMGYAALSIVFSTLSIFVSYAFIFFTWKDLGSIKSKSFAQLWFKAALFLFGISSLGAFSLAGLMAGHSHNQSLYFAALYSFLHFQYNGWFLFGCFGLFFHYAWKQLFTEAGYFSRVIFRILFITCFPACILSILWMELPLWLRLLADAGAIIQLASLFFITKMFMRLRPYFTSSAKNTHILWMLALTAFCIKILLQGLSVIPSLSPFAFGFRPVVIGYLHLSFLGIISFFILGYCNELLGKYNSSINTKGVLLLIAGVIITELTLMSQGLEAIEYEAIPFADYILFGAALMMMTGLGFIGFKKNSFKSVREFV